MKDTREVSETVGQISWLSVPPALGLGMKRLFNKLTTSFASGSHPIYNWKCTMKNYCCKTWKLVSQRSLSSNFDLKKASYIKAAFALHLLLKILSCFEADHAITLLMSNSALSSKPSSVTKFLIPVTDAHVCISWKHWYLIYIKDWKNPWSLPWNDLRCHWDCCFLT